VLLFGFACRASDVPNSKRAVATSSSQVSTVSTVASSSSNKDAAATAAAELKPKPSRPKLQDPLIWIDLEMTGVHATLFCLVRLCLLNTDVALLGEAIQSSLHAAAAAARSHRATSHFVSCSPPHGFE
jgi:hypothetical protein